MIWLGLCLETYLCYNMEASEVSAQKVYIGPSFPVKVDFSKYTVAGQNPFNGTLSVFGPSFFGATNPVFAKGGVNIGPPVGSLGAAIRPDIALDVTGGTHHMGFMENFGFSNFFGTSNTIGLLNNIGTKNVFGLMNRVGFHVAVGGECNAQPNKVDAAGNMTTSAPFWVHNGPFHVNGFLSFTSSIVGTSKLFRIQHPTKPEMKLQHGCLEGPELAVYVRGRVHTDGIIELPEYWKGLVRKETITVQLTPIGCYQELFVEKIEWGQRVFVKNAAGGAIDAYYYAMAERADVDKLDTELKS